jgi:DNA-binding XRE family transcriptional regulator
LDLWDGAGAFIVGVTIITARTGMWTPLQSFLNIPSRFHNQLLNQRGIPCQRTIADYIRKRRLDLGLQQHEVAETIGVTESTIWNWEHGTKPLAKYLPKIIKFLGNI